MYEINEASNAMILLPENKSIGVGFVVGVVTVTDWQHNNPLFRLWNENGTHVQS